MPTEDEKATTERRLLASRHTKDTRKEKMEEAESNTLASLRSGAMSILEAIAVELPDVFAVEVLSKVDLRDTLSLAQVSKRYRDAGQAAVLQEACAALANLGRTRPRPMS